MTEQRLPWYKRYPADFIASTLGMSWEVKTVYSLVLDLIYLGGGSCAEDDAWVANMLGVGMSLQRWRRIKSELVERDKLTVSDGRIFNRRASRLLNQAFPGRAVDTVMVAQPPKINGKQNGKENGQEKTDLFQPATSTNKDIAEFSHQKIGQKTPISEAMPARARSEAEAEQKESTGEIIIQVTAIASALNQKPGRYWEQDYRRLLADDGLSFDDILAAAKAHRGDPIKSIRALRGLAISKRDSTSARRPSQPQVHTLATVAMTATITVRQWQTALVLLCDKGIWNEAKYGPVPTRPGHLVPAEQYAEWLTVWQLQGSHPIHELDDGSNLVKFPSPRFDPMMRAIWEPQP